MTAESLDKILDGFYKSKNIEDATLGLQYWLEQSEHDEDLLSDPIPYIFMRISTLSPEAHEAFSKLKESNSWTNRSYCYNDFWELIIHGSQNPAISKPFQGPVEHPQDLDMLWAEFFVSGDIHPLQQIVSVLDWNDLVRERLNKWLHRRKFPFFNGKQKTTENLLHECLFPIDFDRKIIDEPLDLDMQVALCAKNGLLKFNELPFSLSEQELVRLAMKSAAVWSLTANANTHEIVADFCKAEAKLAGGASRLLLRS